MMQCSFDVAQQNRWLGIGGRSVNFRVYNYIFGPSSVSIPSSVHLKVARILTDDEHHEEIWEGHGGGGRNTVG